MIEIHGENGKIGEVALKGGRVAGSTPAIQDIADHMLRKHGTPQKAFRAMAAMNNGYVWAQSPPGIPAAAQFARTWGELAAVIEMSAETGRLAVTPAPRGKPGGPGLYRVRGNEHSPYMQQIVKALIRKGMPPGKAYAIAWGSMRRWAGGKGKVHPEVRAAAAGGLALEKVAEARAHAHAWDGVAGAVELAGGAMATAGKNAAPPGPSLYDRYVAQVQQLQAAVALRMQAASARKAIAASGVKVPASKSAPGQPGGAPGAPTIPELQARIASLTAQVAALIKASGPPAKTPAPAAAGGQSHAATWADVAGSVELAVTTGQPRQPAGQTGGGQQSAAQRDQPRVPAGQAGGGRFGSGGGQSAPAGKPAVKGKPKPDAHQQHVAHAARVQSQAKAKAGLLNTAKTDRAKANALMAQRKALMAQLASASGKTSSGQAGSTTSAGASTTASSAPAAASAASAPAAPAPTSSAPSSTAGAAAAPTSAQLTTAIAGLTTQINALLAAASQATAQAAKL